MHEPIAGEVPNGLGGRVEGICMQRVVVVSVDVALVASPATCETTNQTNPKIVAPTVVAFIGAAVEVAGSCGMHDSSTSQ